MREEILKILNSTNRKLNPKEIMDMIKEDNTVEELRELIHELDLMCRDGILRCTSGNTYVMNDLLIGTVDMHERGNAHIIIENHDEPRGATHYLPEHARNDAGKKMLGTVSVLLRGIPFIYQGQEIGMTNCKRNDISEYDDISTIDQYQEALRAGLSEEEALKCTSCP